LCVLVHPRGLPAHVRGTRWFGRFPPELGRWVLIIKQQRHIDRKGLHGRTGPAASIALRSAFGSPRSTLVVDPVAMIAGPSSPRFAPC
jgi:hypothetical protein